MIKIKVQAYVLEIHPISQDELQAVLNVYKQCEDFLALGPVVTASSEMVVQDIETSKQTGGVFCGIYTADEHMIGVVDYIPNNYQGYPRAAFLSLLMIAVPFRNQGIGKAVVAAVENEIRKDPTVNIIFPAFRLITRRPFGSGNAMVISFPANPNFTPIKLPQLIYAKISLPRDDRCLSKVEKMVTIRLERVYVCYSKNLQGITRIPRS